jgi:RimJ/RimL family protein N-acetyltransferase
MVSPRRADLFYRTVAPSNDLQVIRSGCLGRLWGMTSLETERLVLRAFREEDLDTYAALCADPEVMRFLGSPLDRAGAWRSMATTLGHLHLRGFSQSAVVEKASGRVIGRGGLWRPEGWPGLEVGWVLARDAWGKGYATELGSLPGSRVHGSWSRLGLLCHSPGQRCVDGCCTSDRTPRSRRR